jgi:hypothetical protein
MAGYSVFFHFFMDGTTYFCHKTLPIRHEKPMNNNATRRERESYSSQNAAEASENNSLNRRKFLKRGGMASVAALAAAGAGAVATRTWAQSQGSQQYDTCVESETFSIDPIEIEVTSGEFVTQGEVDADLEAKISAALHNTLPDPPSGSLISSTTGEYLHPSHTDWNNPTYSIDEPSMGNTGTVTYGPFTGRSVNWGSWLLPNWGYYWQKTATVKITCGGSFTLTYRVVAGP